MSDFCSVIKEIQKKDHKTSLELFSKMVESEDCCLTVFKKKDDVKVDSETPDEYCFRNAIFATRILFTRGKNYKFENCVFLEGLGFDIQKSDLNIEIRNCVVFGTASFVSSRVSRPNCIRLIGSAIDRAYVAVDVSVLECYNFSSGAFCVVNSSVEKGSFKFCNFERMILNKGSFEKVEHFQFKINVKKSLTKPKDPKVIDVWKTVPDYALPSSETDDKGNTVVREEVFSEIDVEIVSTTAEFLEANKSLLTKDERAESIYQKNWVGIRSKMFKLIYVAFGGMIRPRVILVWIMAIIFVFACIYMNGSVMHNDAPQSLCLPHAIYFSTVTFTTLGYGEYVPTGGLLLAAIIESILGMFFGGMFLVVFMRKYFEK